MFGKKKKKFNLYLDEIDYIDSEDDLLDEELLDEVLLEEDAGQISEEELDLIEEELEQEEKRLEENASDKVAVEDYFSVSSQDPVDPVWQMEPESSVPQMEPEDPGLEWHPSDPDYGTDQGDVTALADTGREFSEAGFSDPAPEPVTAAVDISSKENKKDSKSAGRKGILGKKNNKSSAKKNKKKDNTSKAARAPKGPGRRMSKKSKIAIAGVAAALVLGAAIFFIVRNMGGGDDSKVYVENVGELTGLGSANGMSNRYTGTVEAQESWKITLQPDMSVAKCYVSVGDEVKKGDKLFSYNTEELKLNKEKKELEVETLTNEITQRTKDINEYQENLKTASASEKIQLQTEILTAQTTIKKNEFTIKSSKEEIKEIEKNIKDATVKSKMAGLVKSINTSLGQSSDSEEQVGSYDDGSGDSTYMTILALGDYRVKGKISETNIWMLGEGDPVIVRSRLDDTATWRGTIKTVKTDTNDETDTSNSDMDYYDSGDNTKETASSYNFYVNLDSDDGLMLGQHVLIEVDNGQDDEKTGMWLTAAYLPKEGDKYYVWADNGRGRLTLKSVKVGNHDEELDEYEITEGLAITDYIASDTGDLHENMRTSKVDAESDEGEYLEEEYNDDQVYDDMDSGGDNDSGQDVDSLGDDEGLGPDVIDESDSGLDGMIDIEGN